MSAGKVVSLIIGSLILIVGIALLFGGGALVGVDLGFTDDEGFLTSPAADLERDTYSLIALEDLTLRFMTANHHLALSAYDASLGEFQQLLAYKAESAGTQVVTVNPAYTSQACAACGMIVEKNLRVRTHCCTH